MGKILIAKYERFEFILGDILLVFGGILFTLQTDIQIPLSVIGGICIGIGFWLGFRVLKKFQLDLYMVRKDLNQARKETSEAHEKIIETNEKINKTKLYLDSTMADLKKIKNEVEVNNRKLASYIDPKGF